MAVSPIYTQPSKELVAQMRRLDERYKNDPAYISARGQIRSALERRLKVLKPDQHKGEADSQAQRHLYHYRKESTYNPNTYDPRGDASDAQIPTHQINAEREARARDAIKASPKVGALKALGGIGKVAAGTQGFISENVGKAVDVSGIGASLKSAGENPASFHTAMGDLAQTIVTPLALAAKAGAKTSARVGRVVPPKKTAPIKATAPIQQPQAKPVTQAVNYQKDPTKGMTNRDLSTMSAREIEALEDAARQYERTAYDDALGENSKAFQKALRQADADEYTRLVDNLTPAQRQRIFGGGEEMAADDIAEYREIAVDVALARNADELGFDLEKRIRAARASQRAGEPLDPLAEFALARIGERAKQLGIDPQDILDTAVAKRVLLSGKDGAEQAGVTLEEARSAMTRFSERKGAMGGFQSRQRGATTLPGVTPPAPTGNDAIGKIRQAMREANRFRKAEADPVKHEELVKRAEAIGQIQQMEGGRIGFYSQMKQLKGDVGMPTWNASDWGLVDEEVDELFNIIQQRTDMKPFDKLTAQKGLHNLLDGTLPTAGEIEWLRKVFGKDLAVELQGQRSNILDTISGLRKAGMLSGLRTIGRNVGGNAAGAAFDSVARIPGALVDMVLGPLLGRGRALTGPNWQAAQKTIAHTVSQKTGRDMAKILKEGATAESLLKYETPQMVTMLNGHRLKWLDAYANTIFNVQAATDFPFRELAWKRSLVEQAQLMAKAEKLKGSALQTRTQQLINAPTDSMLLNAVADSEEAVFANSNWFTDFVDGGFHRLQKTGGKHAAAGARTLLDIFLPFRKIPSNLAGRVIESSPIGLGYNALLKVPYLTMRKLITKTGIPAREQKKLSMALGRGSLGTGLVTLGYMLAKNGKLKVGEQEVEVGPPGMVTGSYKRDPGKVGRDEVVGTTPGTVLIGNERYRLGDTPLGQLIIMGAGIHEDETNLKKPVEFGGALAMQTAKMAADMPMLTGAEEAAKLTTQSQEAGGGRNWQKTAGSYLGSYVPTFIADSTAIGDPYKRTGDTIAESIAVRLPDKLPGVAGRSSVVADRDALGRPIKKPTGARFLNPYQAPPTNERNALEKELNRLKVPLQLPTRVRDEKRPGYAKDQAEYQHRVRIIGSIVEDTLNTFISDPGFSYADETDEMKRKKIQFLQKYVRMAANKDLNDPLYDREDFDKDRMEVYKWSALEALGRNQNIDLTDAELAEFIKENRPPRQVPLSDIPVKAPATKPPLSNKKKSAGSL